jgi:hypothetical protein
MMAMMPSQLSMKTQMKDLNRKTLGNDFGRLPNVLLLPPDSRDLPSWFGPGFTKRLRMRWKLIKDSVVGSTA